MTALGIRKPMPPGGGQVGDRARGGRRNLQRDAAGVGLGLASDAGCGKAAGEQVGVRLAEPLEDASPHAGVSAYVTLACGGRLGADRRLPGLPRRRHDRQPANQPPPRRARCSAASCTAPAALEPSPLIRNRLEKSTPALEGAACCSNDRNCSSVGVTRGLLRRGEERRSGAGSSAGAGALSRSGS